MTDPRTPFPPKRYKDTSDEDSALSFRAMIHHVAPAPTGVPTRFVSMFPSTQYTTTDNKHDFNRVLNAYLATLDWSKVEVLQGGKHLYSFDK